MRIAPAPAALAVWLGLVGCTAAAGDPPARTAAGDPTAGAAPTAAAGPIVVELFTSQGCSSCPPADRVLSKLVTEGAIGDREVVPLAFHVDYWNDLGWADPFSREEWTDRQRRYAGTLGEGRVYTPQLVVGGRDHVVGSNAAGVIAKIEAASVPVRLDATVDWTARTATVTASAPARADAWVAIYEDAITTSVVRGENAGETLRNDHVVRRLEKVAAAGTSGTISVALDPAWKQLGAVVLAQGADQAIVGTRALPPRAPDAR